MNVSDNWNKGRIISYIDDSQTIKMAIPRTLRLTDDLFSKDLTSDFIYYLSQDDHTIKQIDATQISDSKMK